MKFDDKTTRFIVALSSFVIPMMCIFTAIVLSNWFNIFENALSDLGHATKSHVAPVFNTGLSLGGLIIAIGALKYLSRLSSVLAFIGIAIGYLLILVAVFDEVYGVLHFYVSAMFFLLLLVMVLYYSFITKTRFIKLLALLLVLTAVTSWFIHFTFKLPRGAAIPELVSIFTALPFYLHAYIRAEQPVQIATY